MSVIECEVEVAGSELLETITRAQLIEVAERLIAWVDENRRWSGSGSWSLHPEAERVREMARTVPIVAGRNQWWDSRVECGCLVGTLLHRIPDVEDSQGSPLFHLGGQFPAAMTQVTGQERRAEWLVVVD